MKKLLSILLFACFLCLSGWEIIPKFYQKATSENTELLFVAKSQKNDTVEKKKAAEEKAQEIDYKKLLQDLNTDGA